MTPTNPPAKHPSKVMLVLEPLTYWNDKGELCDTGEKCLVVDDPDDPSPEAVPYVPAALLQEERARAFDAVLAEAQRIYEEEHDSDPSDYFYTKKAVEAARSPGDAEK